MRMRSKLDSEQGSTDGAMVDGSVVVVACVGLMALRGIWMSFGRCSGSLHSQQAWMVVQICLTAGRGRRWMGAETSARWMQRRPDTACVLI